MKQERQTVRAKTLFPKSNKKNKRQMRYLGGGGTASQQPVR